MSTFRTRAVLSLVGWTFMGLFFGTQNVLRYAYAGGEIGLGEALGRGLLEAWVWSALTPAILWLGCRFRLERAAWWWRLPLHGVAALVFATLHIVGFAYAAGLLLRGGAPPVEATAMLSGVLVYVILVGIAHALHAQDAAREREARAARLESQLTRARLDLLRAQLQPHFLFNTLHAISELMHEDVDRADALLADLGDLLRLAIDRAEETEVSLRQELEFTRRYLAIEEARFPDRLDVAISVPSELLDVRVPYLALQPLVENAVHHGVAQQRGPCRIEIAARRDGERLELEVRDTGPGLAPDHHEGVGLRNTRARLDQLYGDAHRLEIGESVDGGALARMSIPLVASDLRTGAPLSDATGAGAPA